MIDNLSRLDMSAFPAPEGDEVTLGLVGQGR